MTIVATKVDFSVQEGFFAKHSRALLLEDNWRQAIRLLTQLTTPPLSLDNAVKVLSGECTVLGDIEGVMTLSPQDKTNADFLRHKHQLEWQKAGIMERDGKFYQPLEEIHGFSKADEEFAVEYLKRAMTWVTCDGYRQQRAKFYTQWHPGSIVCFDAADNPILFRLVCDPPFWMPAFTDAKAAFTDFMKKRSSSLESVGQDAVRADDVAFYLGALAHDLLILGGDYRLPKQAQTCLDKLMKLRSQVSEAVDEANEHSELQFDARGYGITEERLMEQYGLDARVLIYQHRIEMQAEKVGGFLNLPVKYPDGERLVRIPYAPFLHWASRTGDRKEKQMGTLPIWTRVCPPSFKMLNDNPMHTDWWIGAGLPLDDAYVDDHPVTQAAWHYAFGLARTKGAQCVRLAGKGKVTGPVFFPAPNEGVPAGAIAVVPSAGPAYEIALISACKEGAGAVIAAVGGKLAHLAIVSRELGARLVVVDNAMTIFKAGQTVVLDLDTGKLEILEPELDD